MPFVYLDDQGSGKQMVFQDPSAIILAETRDELPTAFAEIKAAQASGKWLAGSLAYELGHALEYKFAPPESAPLIQLGVFEAPKDHAPIEWLYTRDVPTLSFRPDWSEADYLSRFERVQKYLRAGDCYQVNLTFPMRAESDISPTQLYAAFRRRQPGRYGAIVKLGSSASVSFSPELFFEKRGREMRMRPMKGTRPRGQDDAAILAEMRAEPKSQAENLMIVDLLRNDLSRLCEAGSVKVPELFALETYPTLHQMTSQVTGQLRHDVGWNEIFEGLFPCGSVTGAPKIRAMEIIEELESSSRGNYCGSVGYIAPNGDASFSVAIRTVQMSNGELRYDVGSGVVLDSDGQDEYRECLLKAQIFKPQDEGAIETFRRLPSGKIPRRERHIARLSDIVGHDVTREFQKVETLQPKSDLRVKLQAESGRIDITATPYESLETPLPLALSRYPLTSDVQNTRFKTSFRDFYDGERARISAITEAAEVIFLNAAGLVCEGSFTSLFIEKDGRLLTPELSSGLLPGVLRAELVETGKAHETSLTIDDLKSADAVYVGNSLRGLILATFIDYLEH
ncbi:aminodeoxychorismate synthase component I [Litorimonas sp. WD9-15]|uniref:aminodeoxychorismate synthase component I n=1 Tax=Litorimonas sp. WD9-15 TaxID=3418716 RepID=UPI003D02C688